MHIVTGVIWVGSLFVVVVFLQPIVAEIGSAAAPFMAELRRRRLVDVILVDALIAIATGSPLSIRREDDAQRESRRAHATGGSATRESWILNPSGSTPSRRARRQALPRRADQPVGDLAKFSSAWT